MRLGRFVLAKQSRVFGAEARRLFGEHHEETLACINGLVELYQSWNKPEETAK